MKMIDAEGALDPELAELETKDEGGGGNADDDVTKVEDAIANLTKTFEEKMATVESDLKAAKERADKLEQKLNRPGATGDDDKAGKVEAKAFSAFIRKGREALGADEVKALRIADDTGGGYLAPEEFVAEVIKDLTFISPVRQAARVGKTSAGEVVIPKRTGKPTASWVGETETRPTTQSTYGQAEIEVYEMACYVDVSTRLLEDSAVSVDSEVASDLAEEFGRLEAVAFIAGDGVKKPRGFMSNTDVPYTFTGNASTLGTAPADKLIDLMYALSPFYRANASWMMNGATLAEIRKLKDSQGQFLWQPSLQVGQPETILGRPVIEAPDMPSIGSAAEPVIFGDFSRAYRIYDRVSLSVMRDPYSVATSGLVRFHARRRVGGDTVLAAALRKLRCATS